MGFGEAIKSVLSQYATFGGRARRSEYWYYTLFTFILYLVIAIIDVALKSAVLGYVVELALLVPTLAVGCRRLHDTDRHGAWLFIVLIPLVGAILLIVWFCQDSTPGNNKYGPSPKAASGRWQQGGYPDQGYGGQGYGEPGYNA